MKNLKGIVGLIVGGMVAGVSTASAVVTDMSAEVTSTVTTIEAVQNVVAATVIFFTLLAIYKWVKKR